MADEYAPKDSIWSNVFNAFKDLFNMNTQPVTDFFSRPATRADMRNSMARNSIYRGYNGGSQVEDQTGSGNKQRPSLL